MPSPLIRILILGGGFGGISTYLGLHKRLHGNSHVAVTIVSNRDVFEFLPMLHEVATGGLLPSSIRLPLRSIPQCCLAQFIEGTAQSINFDARTVTVHVPTTHQPQTLSYDYLVVALGSTTNFLDIPGAQEFSYTLKNLGDARRIKTRIISQFDRAAYVDSEIDRSRMLCFTIVGGGPTGVEFAGELSDLIRHELTRAYPRLAPHARIVLLQSADRLVPQVAPWFDQRARAILHRTGMVDIRLRTRVRAVRPQEVQLEQDTIATETVIWTAGVHAQPIDALAMHPMLRDEKTKRWKVNAHLQLPSYSEVFVVGDLAWIFDHASHQPYPMRAQFAVREGTIAAENITRHIDGLSLRAFAWRDMGFLLSLGKGGAIGETFGLRWSGPVAWWLYRTAYLMKLFGIRAKLRTALEWTINLFAPRDLAKL